MILMCRYWLPTVIMRPSDIQKQVGEIALLYVLGWPGY